MATPDLTTPLPASPGGRTAGRPALIFVVALSGLANYVVVGERSHRTRRPKMSATYGPKLRIPYTGTDFPTDRLNGPDDLKTGWDELLASALTVGRPSTAFVFRHGNPSLHEATFRIALVYMALERARSTGELRRTEAFMALDPTEKGAVSYFLGMAVCKLFASRLLHVPWLLHLDVFRDQLHAVTLGRSRPDLVGQDHSGRWYAFECKGRSSVPSVIERKKAKTQAQRVVSVNSKSCRLYVGAISYFRQNELEFHWRDPEPDESERPEPIALRLPEQAWRYYYEPALALSMVDGADNRAVPDVEVRIHAEVRELLLAGAWTRARQRAMELSRVLRDEGYQPDGIQVVAGDSWLAPRERLRGDV